MLFSVRFGMSNQIKSNQIISYFPISHIPYNGEYNHHFPEFEWVKEDLSNYHHNTIHISFHFNLLFMINMLSQLLWPLMIVMRLSRSSPARAPSPSNEMVCSLGRSRMRNENENDVLDLPSLEIVTFGNSSFCYCHVVVFESMWWLFIFISFFHSRSSQITHHFIQWWLCSSRWLSS